MLGGGMAPIAAAVATEALAFATDPPVKISNTIVPPLSCVMGLAIGSILPVLLT